MRTTGPRASKPAGAIQLAPDDCEGPRWNAGIAATALGDWPTARASWRGQGLPIPDGEGPIDMQLGLCSLRVAGDDAVETVFAQRIDPCRARIESVPLPESGRRYGDVILHDGEARGRRVVGSRNITCSTSSSGSNARDTRPGA